MRSFTQRSIDCARSFLSRELTFISDVRRQAYDRRVHFDRIHGLCGQAYRDDCRRELQSLSERPVFCAVSGHLSAFLHGTLLTNLDVCFPQSWPIRRALCWLRTLSDLPTVRILILVSFPSLPSQIFFFAVQKHLLYFLLVRVIARRHLPVWLIG